MSAYLEASGLAAGLGPEHFFVLGGGVSCTTIRVTPPAGQSFIIKQALPRLRVKSRWLSSPDRAHREALGIRYLESLLPGQSVPFLIRDDPENHLLVMEDVPVPHDNWKQLLLAGTLVDDHAMQFGALLASMHDGARRRARELEPVFRDKAFFESLRMEAYYEYTARNAPAGSKFIEALLSDTRSRNLTLVHGDYSPKNVLVRRGKLILLDHETCHWGDPMFDIGFSLTHFLSKANHMPQRRDEFARMAQLYWQAYRKEAGLIMRDSEMEARAVRQTLACLLARVHGRSPLEYLDNAARRRQADCVLDLMKTTPENIPDLIESFCNGVT